MATLDDVRRIGLNLPGASEAPDWFAITVPVKGKDKGFVWTWSERIHPKKPRVRNPGVLVVTVRNLTEKEILLGSDAEKFFTEPHYNGYPAIHVRLDAIEVEELADLVIEAWRCKASPEMIAEYEG